ncbi:hypothetical protein HanIR_Chr15g0760151 [Helianthus annuus]|nr:hypothetical protein HanIR_Chr15g0760151 [Helianthus annuus]
MLLASRSGKPPPPSSTLPLSPLPQMLQLSSPPRQHHPCLYHYYQILSTLTNLQTKHDYFVDKMYRRLKFPLRMLFF